MKVGQKGTKKIKCIGPREDGESCLLLRDSDEEDRMDDPIIEEPGLDDLEALIRRVTLKLS